MDYNLIYNNDFDKKTEKKKQKVFKIFNLEHAKIKINQLCQLHETFEITETKSSIKIKVLRENQNIVYWYANESKTISFLIMLNKLKREFEMNKDNILNCNFSQSITECQYFEFAENINDMTEDVGAIYELHNVWEADISHAYYRAAFVLGFISKKLYKEIVFKISKTDRLKLLGATATTKIKIDYINGIKTEETKIFSNDLYRAAWFKICNYVDTALIDFKGLLKKNFLFYWVDGIYFKYNNLDIDKFIELRKIQYKYNMEFKLIPIKNFKIINKEYYTEIEILKPDGKIKRFFPDKKKIKTYSFVELNN